MNRVLISGTVAEKPRVFHFDAGALTVFTVIVEENNRNGDVFRTYVPCIAWRDISHRAAVLATGDIVLVDGRLSWRTSTNGGASQGRLQVMVWSISALRDLAAEAARQSDMPAEEPATTDITNNSD